MDIIEKLRSRKKMNKKERYFDYNLLFVVLFLIIFGLLMIFSASSYEAGARFGDTAHYLKRQLFASALGVAVMIGVSFVPYKLWKKVPLWVYYGVSLILFFLLLIPAISVNANGATRWIKLVGGFNIQPAEVAKLLIIIFYAKFLSGYAWILKQWKGIAVALGSILPLAVVVWLISDNFSSALILGGIVYLMCFVVCNDWKKFAILTGGLGATAALVVFVIVKFVNEETSSFRSRRIIAWLNPEKFSDSTSYQTLQSLYAIGSGGIFGKGIGESMQKLNYIPEAQNDMIFAIICEELGLFGALGVIVLFVILLWRLMTIAYNTNDLFGALLIVGVFAHIGIQVVLNIAVVTNSVPNTGVALPFISYGGSSVLFLLIEMGIVLNIARYINFKE